MRRRQTTAVRSVAVAPGYALARCGLPAPAGRRERPRSARGLVGQAPGPAAVAGERAVAGPEPGASGTPPADAPGVAQRHPAGGGESDPEMPLKGCRILVVEDETLIAMEMQLVLSDLGAETVGIAATAADALAQAEALRPHLVTMDVRLAGPEDGIEAAIQIRRKLGIRSLFVSAYSEPSILDRAREAEPIGWVSKPFTVHKIARALSSCRD